MLDIVHGVDGVLGYARRALSDAEATGNAIQLAHGYAGMVAVVSVYDRAAAMELLTKVRRCGAIANDRGIADNAALWLAHAPVTGPVDGLTFARYALVSAVSGGYFERSSAPSAEDTSTVSISRSARS